jgi:hypothetical protein
MNLPQEQQEFHTANLLGALTKSLKANRPDAKVDVEDLRVLFNEAEKDKVGNTIETWNHELSTAKKGAYTRLNSVLAHATKGKKRSRPSDSSDESSSSSESSSDEEHITKANKIDSKPGKAPNFGKLFKDVAKKGVYKNRRFGTKPDEWCQLHCGLGDRVRSHPHVNRNCCQQNRETKESTSSSSGIHQNKKVKKGDKPKNAKKKEVSKGKGKECEVDKEEDSSEELYLTNLVESDSETNSDSTTSGSNASTPLKRMESDSSIDKAFERAVKEANHIREKLKIAAGSSSTPISPKFRLRLSPRSNLFDRELEKLSTTLMMNQK